MSDYQKVFCLFCNSGKERSTVRILNQLGLGRAIFPERVKTICLGKNREELTRVPLLPGYVFFYAASAQVKRDALWRCDGVIRVLKYDEDEEEGLQGHDLEFAQWLWDLDGVVDLMKAVKVGDRVMITDPVFQSLHGTIVRMDRRKRTARVRLDSEGTAKFIWLSYEVIEEISE